MFALEVRGPASCLDRGGSSMSGEYEFLKTELDAPVALVRMGAESISTRMLEELGDLVGRLSEDEKLSACVITGEGEAFSVGADLEKLSAMSREEARAYSALGQRTFRSIERSPLVWIAAVNGHALGGGFELTCACDIRTAVPKARLGAPEVGLGLIPGFGGTVRLAQIVGLGRALELVLTGRPISAEDALSWGLVNQLVEPEKLLKNSMRLARRIASSPRDALAAAKLACRESLDPAAGGIEALLKTEAARFAARFTDETRGRLRGESG